MIQSEKVLTKNNNTIRCVELDVLRGIAIIAMIIFHFTFDLGYFGVIASDTIYQPNWILFQKFIAGSFIFIAGISLHLCHGLEIRWAYVKKRVLFLGGVALGISITTIFAFGDFWVKFGILHCILVCSIMSLVFVHRSLGIILAITMALGAVMFLVRTPLDLPVGFHWLIETQIRQYSVDYSPVFPWIFVFSCGILCSKINFVLNLGVPRFVDLMRETRIIRRLAFIGQRSLAIYVIHQPILFLGFYTYYYLT
jgi:uncharacterized membrane protein